jgi:hypothetical protein
VKPYQPRGVWESTTSGRGELARYVQDHGDKLYRRGMYTFIKRTAPPPSMLIFDAPGRDQCEVKRLRTNTPLQALVMLNDPLVLEASRVLAERLLVKGGHTKEQIDRAFRLIVCRPPSSKETERLLQYHSKEHGRFRDNPERAAQYTSAGEYPKNERMDRADVAALMQVIHLLYNLDETAVKP